MSSKWTTIHLLMHKQDLKFMNNDRIFFRNGYFKEQHYINVYPKNAVHNKSVDVRLSGY